MSLGMLGLDPSSATDTVSAYAMLLSKAQEMADMATTDLYMGVSSSLVLEGTLETHNKVQIFGHIPASVGHFHVKAGGADLREMGPLADAVNSRISIDSITVAGELWLGYSRVSKLMLSTAEASVHMTADIEVHIDSSEVS